MTVKAVMFLPVAVSVASWSCSGNHAGQYSEFVSVPAQGWAYGDTVTFTPDSCVTPGMDIALRHNDAFPYSSLWVEVSDSLRRDTLKIDLCDAYGRWLGNGLGSSHQVHARLPFAPEPARTLNIRHIMRVDTVKGIEQIGILPAY